MADKKKPDPEITPQEIPVSEHYSALSKAAIQNQREMMNISAIKFAESLTESVPPLLQARKLIYDHIKALPVDSSFFQGNGYKRELVDIMRRIDKQEITSVPELVQILNPIASQEKSDTLSSLLATVEEIETSATIELDNSLPPPTI